MFTNFKLSTITLTVMGISICFSSMAYEPKKDLSQTIAFLDRQAKLHWFVKNGDAKLPTKARFATWITTLNKSLTFAPYPLEDVKAAGIGGNEKTGFIYYDSQSGIGHVEALLIQRNPITKICYLQNNDIVVRDWNHDLDVVEFPCEKSDQNGLYWYPNYDFVNGAYNPGLDAFYAAQVSNRMYQNEFHVPTWKKSVKAKITLLIHANKTYFNEGGLFYDGTQPWYVSLSDGDAETYPWTTLDVVSHFISVGTALSYWGYSWGIGDGPSIATSYSDIFAKAVEYEVTGKNNWTIGGDVRKGYSALRYMDKPTTDCGYDKNPGDSCSIDNYDDYKKHPYIEPEYGAGLLNKVFYLIATSPDWDTKKAFHLFNHATYYWVDRDWNPDSEDPPGDYLNFHDVFCSLIISAKDLNYEQTKIAGIINALKQVNMDANTCLDKATTSKNREHFG